MTTTHRYLLYARVSPKGSTWSAQETSIAVQLAECRDYIRRMDPQAEFTEVTDEFRSGKDLNRPGMKQILAELDSGRPSFGTLVVWQLDRLSRNLADAAPLFARLRDAGVDFISIRQPYLSATGAMARFNLTQTIAIAQLEREMTSERITAKMRWIAQQGKVTYGSIPLGYRRKPGVKNTLEAVPEEADLVREIFATYLRCATSGGAFEAMRALQAAHPDKICDNKKFYKILRNRLYLGEIVYKGEIFKGEHPAIVDRETFDRVQMLLPGAKHNVPRPGRQKYAYLLAGLVRCSCHPDRYMTPSAVSKSSRRYFYYKCTDPACPSEINAEKLDQAVLDLICRIALDPDYVRGCIEQLDRERAQEQAAAVPALKAAEAAAASASEEVDRIAQAFLTGLVTPENKAFWNGKLADARRAADAAAAELDRQRRKVSDLATHEDELPAILKSLKGWADLLQKAPDDTALKRNLILSVVQQVRCTSKGHFDVDLIMDPQTVGAKKIGTTGEVMPNGGEWWSSRELVITCAIEVTTRGAIARLRDPGADL